MGKERIVIKIGTNVLTNRDDRIVGPVLKNLVRQIAHLYENGFMPVVVSSGSAIAGKEILGECKISDKSIRRQVYSSVGQPRLMRHYYTMFHEWGLRCAQVLATKRDFSPGSHRQNMINCYEGLISEGIIPIANEDDTVSLTMSMFTDNDELAALVAELIQARKLIILTDIDGLFTGNPDDEGTELISMVRSDEKVEQFVRKSNKQEGQGRGGMKSKLKIAKKTAKGGIETYIANGKQENVIIDIIEGKKVGTMFIK